MAIISGKLRWAKHAVQRYMFHVYVIRNTNGVEKNIMNVAS